MASFRDIVSQRRLLLDGSMATMIRRLALSEEQYRGARLKNHPVSLSGVCDILNITASEIIASIHRQYLEAGADIIETNTFNANEISQCRYQMSEFAGEMNVLAARIARAEADRFSTPEWPRFVAGSIGPSEFSLSVSNTINPEPEEISIAFEHQADALIDGGVDLLIIETIYDSMTARAIIKGVGRSIDNHVGDVPLILSVTVDNHSGLMASGEKPEEFLESVDSCISPVAFGVNCCCGTRGLSQTVDRLAVASPYPIVCYPSAGIPDKDGNFPESPESFGEALMQLLQDRDSGLVGGCCGTTPDHIRFLRNSMDQSPYNDNYSEKYDGGNGRQLYCDDITSP